MKQITCITCPFTCRITIDVENGDHVSSGNMCNKGAQFIDAELSAPDHSITTMVKTIFPDIPFLSVRTNGEIPKNKIKKIIRDLSKVIITERKGIGEIVIRNISGTKCNVIATSDMLYTANFEQAAKKAELIKQGKNQSVVTTKNPA